MSRREIAITDRAQHEQYLLDQREHLECTKALFDPFRTGISENPMFIQFAGRSFLYQPRPVSFEWGKDHYRVIYMNIDHREESLIVERTVDTRTVSEVTFESISMTRHRSPSGDTIEGRIAYSGTDVNGKKIYEPRAKQAEEHGRKMLKRLSSSPVVM